MPLDGPPDPALTVAEVAEQLPFPDGLVDDPGFVEGLDILIAAGHKFWSESFAETGSGIRYHTPEFIAYDGKTGDAGPDCGGEPMGVENAAYCRVPGPTPARTGSSAGTSPGFSTRSTTSTATARPRSSWPTSTPTSPRTG